MVFRKRKIARGWFVRENEKRRTKERKDSMNNEREVWVVGSAQRGALIDGLEQMRADHLRVKESLDKKWKASSKIINVFLAGAVGVVGAALIGTLPIPALLPISMTLMVLDRRQTNLSKAAKKEEMNASLAGKTAAEMGSEKARACEEHVFEFDPKEHPDMQALMHRLGERRETKEGSWLKDSGPAEKKGAKPA